MVSSPQQKSSRHGAATDSKVGATTDSAAAINTLDGALPSTPEAAAARAEPSVSPNHPATPAGTSTAVAPPLDNLAQAEFNSARVARLRERPPHPPERRARLSGVRRQATVVAKSAPSTQPLTILDRLVRWIAARLQALDRRLFKGTSQKGAGQPNRSVLPGSMKAPPTRTSIGDRSRVRPRTPPADTATGSPEEQVEGARFAPHSEDEWQER